MAQPLPSQPPRTLLSYNDTGPSNSAQYLYGFTITFIALFVAFAMCAYSSRRGRWRRDMRVMHWTDPVPLEDAQGMELAREQERERPVYEEVWLREKGGRWGWADVEPLSATLPPTTTPANRQPPLDPVAARARRLNPYLKPALPPSSSHEHEEAAALQVSLLLSMPCPRTSKDGNGIGDVVLGVARVPWPGLPEG